MGHWLPGGCRHVTRDFRLRSISDKSRVLRWKVGRSFLTSPRDYLWSVCVTGSWVVGRCIGSAFAASPLGQASWMMQLSMSLLLVVSSVVPSLWMCPFAYLSRPSIDRRAGFVDVVLAGPRPAQEAARRFGGLMQNLLILAAHPDQGLRHVLLVLLLAQCGRGRSQCC